MLELDHVITLVRDPDAAVVSLEGDGWVLDAGAMQARAPEVAG